MNTTAPSTATRNNTRPMTGVEFIHNPDACPYCRGTDTRTARAAIGRACNTCGGLWSLVYRGAALVGYDPHRQHETQPRQTTRDTAPFVPAQVPPRAPALALDSIGDAVADLMRD